jgi:hypothetical protein
LLRPCAILLLLLFSGVAALAGEYHLTARPWKPLRIPVSQYLEVIEGECRFAMRHQNAEGAIIDPFLQREHQYATPYFAYAAGTVVHAGRGGRDILAAGVRAMEHATKAFATGRKSIPDDHGEFFIAALTGALDLYREHVPHAQVQEWRRRLSIATSQAVQGNKNNWETYVMKGDWMRSLAGLLDRGTAVRAIEEAWTERQSKRIAAAPWYLYHDRTSDPDTLSVEAVGRGNLLALTALGYDGPSAAAIRRATHSASRVALQLQDPGGQTPSNGRTDNHVWVETGYQLIFETMAAQAVGAGDSELAGQFRHAAMLSFQSAMRWQRKDAPWDGSFYVTKNHFDPALRVGYQPASQYTNYNGSLMFRLAEAFHASRNASSVAERPSPSEIGGYAFALDEQFASAFANAGGMYVQVNLRGQERETHANHWTPLGLVRFARAGGWDGRLGPSDGALHATDGVSFAPVFREGGEWRKVSGLSQRYQAKFETIFAHPLLIRVRVTYGPKPGAVPTSPVFQDDLTITPDGVLSELRRLTGGSAGWGMIWPVLESDGRPLQPAYSGRIASTRYPTGTDVQSFVGLDPSLQVDASGPSQRSTFGDLRPVRVTIPDTAGVLRTFVYPASMGDPGAPAVQKSFRQLQTGGGFSTILGKVTDKTYAGRWSAGGVAREIDVNGDGRADLTFDRECGFIAQLDERKRVVALEADQAVKASISWLRKTIKLEPFTPWRAGY